MKTMEMFSFDNVEVLILRDPLKFFGRFKKLENLKNKSDHFFERRNENKAVNGFL